MRILSALSICLLAIFTFNCNPSNSNNSGTDSTSESKPSTTKTPTNLPAELIAGLNAHGGLGAWSKMKMMEYTLGEGDAAETHLINLANRKTLISQKDFQIGFDGQEVWVAPNKNAYREGKSSARFYHNLNFYFFAMPFVLADPGINYEILPQKEMDGKTYDGVKVSYNEGVGDSPEDYYIAYFDSETHQMYLLLYTVTYYSGEANEKYRALVYDNWETVNGLLLPKTLKGFTYEDGELGETRYEKVFENLKLSETAPEEGLFEMPAEAEIDSLISE